MARLVEFHNGQTLNLSFIKKIFFVLILARQIECNIYYQTIFAVNFSKLTSCKVQIVVSKEILSDA